MEVNAMKTLLRSFIQQRRAWLPVIVSLALFCRTTSAQSFVISNYGRFISALNGNTVITNFSTNTTISLTTLGQTINISRNTVIDGGTNNLIFDGNALTRIFFVKTNCQLILNNAQLLNGRSTNGGAICSLGPVRIYCSLLGTNAAERVATAAAAFGASTLPAQAAAVAALAARPFRLRQ
jgi:hypothetical protein